MDWYSRYLYSIVLSVLNGHSSAVVLKDVNLNWKEANEACQLIKFSQVKTEYKTFINEMDQGTPGYWIQDAVTEFSVVNKGCQKNVNILGSTTVENNRLLNCFQFCQNNANTTTIGVKGNNCSCLASLTSDTYLPIDNCDIPCVWEDRLCEMATVFSVFERQDSIGELGGFQIEECISIFSGSVGKLNCSSQNRYICQKNGILREFLDKVTWMEAVSKCAKQNQTLAYYLPFYVNYNRLRYPLSRYWIGIRQFYQIETVKQGSSSCPVIRQYNSVDIRVENSNCDEKKKYICSKVIGVVATVAILLLGFVCISIRRRSNSFRQRHYSQGSARALKLLRPEHKPMPQLTYHQIEQFFLSRMGGKPLAAERIPWKRKHTDEMMEDPRKDKYLKHSSGYSSYIYNCMVNTF
uniref:C-type lectin domain-containing protein n=1 Tax=Magallana gigas TaxID=29159 RepID=A0A8W8ND69_MAGGI